MNKASFLWGIPLLLWGWTTSPLQAAPIDWETAREKAAALLRHGPFRTASAEMPALRLATRDAYLFETASAFALMAADDELPEVLGYGPRSEGPLPPGLYGYLASPKFPQPASTRQECRPVAALLPFVRHQRAPYNSHCPFYKNSAGETTRYRCVVGCVATALEEVISYYRRTVVLQDTLHGWESPHHSPVADVLPGTRVDCRLIRNNYDTEDYSPEEADAVARLSYYCGVAAKMKWGIESSGANASRLTAPLKKAFGYGYVQEVDSYQYTPDDWQQLIRNELYAGRPVFYTAFNMWMGGHAFVIDGLDENGFVHVNWGYGGSYDGFFRLDVLNYNEPPGQLTPEGMEAGFFCNHQALLLHPDPQEVQLPTPLARTGQEISITQVRADLPPETGKRTPLTIDVRNNTGMTLTTPFEFFTNAEQDTALLEQGDFIALGGVTLGPHEHRRLKIHASFEEAGQRILRISPDDSTFLRHDTLQVAEGRPPQLTFHEPHIECSGNGRIRCHVPVSNAATAGRCGQEVLYEVGPGDAQTVKDGVRHSRHLYILPGETKTDTISFGCLLPGATYTLLVRSPWNVMTQKTFVVPDLSGIVPDTLSGDMPKRYYDLSGKPLECPPRNGIYLQGEGNSYKKIYRKH